MNETALLQNYLILGGLIFSIGLIGFVVRRNMIVMFLCAEMMLQGVSLNLVAWSGYHQNWGGQMLVLFMIAVAACEAALGLALMLMLYHKSETLDIAFWQDLREAGQPSYVDHEVPEERHEDAHWPSLIPAGRQPTLDTEELGHRSRV